MAEYYAMNMQANFYDVGKSEHALGDAAVGSLDSVWVYGECAEPVAVGSCTMNDATFAITDLAGTHTAIVAGDTGDFMWIRRTLPLSP